MDERTGQVRPPSRHPLGIPGRLAILGVLVAGIGFGLAHPGHGPVAFGRSYNADSGTIGDPAASYHVGEHFVWVAHFGRQAGTTHLVRTLSRRDASGARSCWPRST